MTTARWPAYARIEARSYELASRPTVVRTEFDDGAVRQARTVSQPMTQRRVAAQIPAARLVEFRTWAAAYTHGYFAMRDGVDGEVRGVRVVGGAGGITYRWVSRMWWEAELVIEDAHGIAAGAPWFADTALEVVASEREASTVTLPGAQGGVAPITYTLTPDAPAGFTLDAAARTLASGAASREIVDGAVHQWQAEDGFGRRASMAVSIARAVRLDNFSIGISGSGPIAFVGGSISPIRLPDRWFTGTTTPADRRYLESLRLRPGGRNATLKIGPFSTSENLSDDAERRLRMRPTMGGRVGPVVPGPGFADSVTTDTTDPYLWKPPASVAAQLDPWAAAVIAAGDRSNSHLHVWLAAP